MNTVKIIKRVSAKNVSTAVAVGRLLLDGWECPAAIISTASESELRAYIAARGQRLLYSEPTETYYAS
jgi:hypothetical protein